MTQLQGHRSAITNARSRGLGFVAEALLLLLLSIVGITIVPATLSAQDPPIYGVLAPLSVCRDYKGFASCVVAVERHMMSQAAGRVVRRDSVLEIRTERDTLVLADNNFGSAYVRHLFAGQLPGGKYAVIERLLYEGYEYLLIDWRSADSTRLPAPPVIAPTGDRFAVASRAEKEWYADNVLQVWRLTADGPLKEFEVRGGFGCGPAAIRWVDASSIEFVWVDENRGRKIPAKLVRESSGSWILNPPPEGYGSYYECRK